jgi:hypothetical protein
MARTDKRRVRNGQASTLFLLFTYKKQQNLMASTAFSGLRAGLVRHYNRLAIPVSHVLSST